MLIKKPNLAKYAKRMTDNNLPLIANEIISDIVIRTQKGKDVNNRSFKPYSKAYSIKKGTTSVNLTQSGRMLNSITFRKLPNGIRLFFGASKENKKAHGNQSKNNRKFFGLDKSQVDYINNYIKKRILK